VQFEKKKATWAFPGISVEMLWLCFTSLLQFRLSQLLGFWINQPSTYI